MVCQGFRLPRFTRRKKVLVAARARSVVSCKCVRRPGILFTASSCEEVCTQTNLGAKTVSTHIAVRVLEGRNWLV